MNAPLNSEHVLRFSALGLMAGKRHFTLDAGQVGPGDWLLITPFREALGPDLATVTARVFCTLAQPHSGDVAFFGAAATGLGYHELTHLRTRLGFVPGSGGLLSNRTLRENIALPISVHSGLAPDHEAQRVEAILQSFGLTAVADSRPHEVSGGTRFRTCAARATALSPELIVVEGLGDFVSEEETGMTWTRLLGYRTQRGAAMVVCLARPEAGFEAWFRAQGGNVLRYRILSEPPFPALGRATP